MTKLHLTTLEVETFSMSDSIEDQAQVTDRTCNNACISSDCLTERTCNPVDC
jgi:hypothetical protein